MSNLPDPDARRQLAAKNESLFREANEHIEEISSDAAFVSFVCECADVDCNERLSLTLEEYEHVRSQPNRFIVLPGHNVPDLDLIQVASDRYFVVSKLGTGAQVARELDPRSSGR